MILCGFRDAYIAGKEEPMLREEKIRRMTDIALFEKQNREDLHVAGAFFRSDYIGRHLVRAFLGFSISWFLIAGFWFFLHLDVYLGSITEAGIRGVLLKGAGLYAAGLLLFLLISFTVANARYLRAVKRQEEYLKKLDIFRRRSEFHNRAEKLLREEKGL